MKKLFLILPSVMALVYIFFILNNNETLDLSYRLITLTAIIYAVFRTLTKAARLRDRGALFTGALGLLLLAASEVYYTANAILAQGGKIALSISDYSDACSYLFFLSAVSLLLILRPHMETAFKVGLSVASVVIVFLTTYSIMADDHWILSITASVTAFLSILLSLYLFYQTRKFKQLRPAAFLCFSLIFLGIADIFVYSTFLFGIDYLTLAFAALYMPVYIWICEGLTRLRKEDVKNEEEARDG